jgi:membrane protein implicated in regulation of membrane protease activity
MDGLLKQGIAAYQSGDPELAHEILEVFVRHNPDNADGWDWFFNVCNTDDERVHCLKQMIRINPHNEKAIQLLEKLAITEQPLELPGEDEIPEDDLRNDTLARKVTRALLIFQVAAVLVGIILISGQLSSIALWIAFVSLVVLAGAILWFHIRYRSSPAVQEKLKLNQQDRRLEAQILAANASIKLAQQNREKIESAEQAERVQALQDFQNGYIECGMVNSQVAQAFIPGLSPERRQQLAEHGFTSAKNTTWNVINVEGFSPEETQAILNWRNNVFINFIETKPADLPAEKQDEIKKKYQVQLESNTEEQHKLEESRTSLEEAKKGLQPRLEQLVPLPFKSFLGSSLATRGIAAGVIGAGLIFSLLFLGSSATYAAILQSRPTATLTPTVTSTPTATFTQTVTSSPTPTYTPTFTNSPTMTDTPRSDFTPGSTYTPTPLPIFTPTSMPTQLSP